jgi:hypothetical protein
MMAAKAIGTTATKPEKSIASCSSNSPKIHQKSMEKKIDLL